MTCPLCGRRQGRRNCPARHTTICPTCCATKRLREIDCPDSCHYLASARAHPPAVVQRQREHDLALMAALMDGLSSKQAELFALLSEGIRQHQESSTPRATDADLRDAADAQARTLETAARGILYEHQASTSAAQRLARLFGELVARHAEHRRSTPRESAEVFRRLESAVRAARSTAAGSGSAFLDALERLMADQARDTRGGADGAGRLVTPGQDGPASASGSGRADPPRIILP
jgi:hypothetical protein